MKTLTVENLKDLLGVPGIYTIKINDKYYVGSSASIGHRLKHHLWALQTQQHHNRTMQNLFNKYGQEQTVFYKIEDCELDMLIEREKYHIDALKPYMNHILDPQKIIRDETYKKRLSDGLKKAYAKGLRPHNDKPVHMYDPDGNYKNSYESASHAARAFLKTDASAICMCARGDNYTAYGWRWSYDKVDNLPPFKKKYAYKPIEQISLNGDLVKEWDSAKEAEHELGITNISRAATKNKTAGGYRWKYKS
jgi:group I intron endonuclease